MSRTVNASIIVGVDLGSEEDELPGWVTTLGPDMDEAREALDKMLDNKPFGMAKQVELHWYGHTETPSWILGVEVARTGWGSAKVHPHELSERYLEWHGKVRGVLDRLGAPASTKIGMYLCASFC